MGTEAQKDMLADRRASDFAPGQFYPNGHVC
jgi:hypothetical protein